MIDPRCRTSVGGGLTAVEMKINLYNELKAKTESPSREPDVYKRLSATDWDLLTQLQEDPDVAEYIKARTEEGGPDQGGPLGAATEAAG